MPIQFNCAGCGRPFSVDDSLAGTQAQCNQCGQIITIPTAAPAQFGAAQSGPVQPAALPAYPPQQFPSYAQKGGNAKTVWIIVGSIGGVMFIGILVIIVALSLGGNDNRGGIGLQPSNTPRDGGPGVQTVTLSNPKFYLGRAARVDRVENVVELNIAYQFSDATSKTDRKYNLRIETKSGAAYMYKSTRPITFPATDTGGVLRTTLKPPSMPLNVSVGLVGPGGTGSNTLRVTLPAKPENLSVSPELQETVEYARNTRIVLSNFKADLDSIENHQVPCTVDYRFESGKPMPQFKYAVRALGVGITGLKPDRKMPQLNEFWYDNFAFRTYAPEPAAFEGKGLQPAGTLHIKMGTNMTHMSSSAVWIEVRPSVIHPDFGGVRISEIIQNPKFKFKRPAD